MDLLSGVFGRILSVLRGLSYQRAEVDHPSVLMCLDLIVLSLTWEAEQSDHPATK